MWPRRSRTAATGSSAWTCPATEPADRPRPTLRRHWPPTCSTPCPLPPAPDLAVAHSLGSAALLLAARRLRCARAVHCDPAWLRRSRDLDALRAVKHATRRELRAAHPRWHDDDITAELRALATWDPVSVTALRQLPGLPYAPAVPSLVLLAGPSERIPPAEAAALARRGWRVRTVDGAGHTVHRDDPAGFLHGLRGWL